MFAFIMVHHSRVELAYGDEEPLVLKRPPHVTVGEWTRFWDGAQALNDKMKEGGITR